MMLYNLGLYTVIGMPIFLGLMIWNLIKFQKEDFCISDLFAMLFVSCIPFFRELILFRMFQFYVKDIVLIKARE